MLLFIYGEALKEVDHICHSCGVIKLMWVHLETREACKLVKDAINCILVIVDGLRNHQNCRCISYQRFMSSTTG